MKTLTWLAVCLRRATFLAVSMPLLLAAGLLWTVAHACGFLGPYLYWAGFGCARRGLGSEQIKPAPEDPIPAVTTWLRGEA